MNEVELDRDDDARRAIDGPGSIYQTQRHAFDQGVFCDLVAE